MKGKKLMMHHDPSIPVPRKVEAVIPDGTLILFRRKYKTLDIQDILDVYMVWFDLPAAGVSVEEKNACIEKLEKYLRNPIHDTLPLKKCIDFGVISPTKFGGVQNNTEMHLSYCRDTKQYFFEFQLEGTWEQEHPNLGIETF